VISTATFRSMGCEIVVGGATPAELAEIQSLFAERDGIFSRFRADSELNRVNAAAGRVVAVSPEFARAVGLALEAAASTNGLVDPTLGTAIEDAGYTTDFAELLPDARPAGPGARGRPEAVRLSGRLVSVPTGVLLDLNGVVKSSTVDDALGFLSGPGFVSAGGDLAVSTEVDVGLADGGAIRVVQGGLATSGRTQRKWLRGGAYQHHLIDPRTGLPSESPWEQVTASGATCLDADVAAKAAFLLGEDGPAWLDELGLLGRFSDGDRIVANSAWSGALEGAAACI
jgi:thiamine biosynthesis lipoprotein